MNGSTRPRTRSLKRVPRPSARRTASQPRLPAMPCFGCTNDVAGVLHRNTRRDDDLRFPPMVLQNKDPNVWDLAGAVIIGFDNRQAESVLDIVDDRATDEQGEIHAVLAGYQRETGYFTDEALPPG